jgi:hypothetical protein
MTDTTVELEALLMQRSFPDLASDAMYDNGMQLIDIGQFQRCSWIGCGRKK